jgi:hypothetical protein
MSAQVRHRSGSINPLPDMDLTGPTLGKASSPTGVRRSLKPSADKKPRGKSLGQLSGRQKLLRSPRMHPSGFAPDRFWTFPLARTWRAGRLLSWQALMAAGVWRPRPFSIGPEPDARSGGDILRRDPAGGCTGVVSSPGASEAPGAVTAGSGQGGLFAWCAIIYH